MENYEIWHDENRNENRYWHGLLFVPVKNKDKLIKVLKTVKSKNSIKENDELKFAKCFKKNKKALAISDNISVFSHILKVKNIKEVLYQRSKKERYLKEYPEYLVLCENFGCKFGLLMIDDNMSTMYKMDYGKKVETTFRFIVKCCLNSMFKGREINITKIIFDGYEHNNKSPDIHRLFGKGLNENIHIDKDIEIDVRNRKERDDDSGIAVDFVDNIIGALEAKITEKNDPNKVLQPLDELYHRIVENKIFVNKSSRWHKSIKCSQVVFEKGGIVFKNLPDQSKEQFKLF